MLRDFPLIRREWDPGNPQDPDTLSASYQRFAVKWICHKDPTHRFTATVLGRTARLTGCQRCQRLRGIAAVVKGGNERVRLHLIRQAWGDLEDNESAGSIVTASEPLGATRTSDW